MDSKLFDLFLPLPQQAPGSDACTEHAFSLLPNRDSVEEILDIGCGTGRQTACLLRNTMANVTAIDIWPSFLERVRERARAEGTADRLTTRNLSMGELDSLAASFDLIWAEGSAYILGFEKALSQWPKILRKNGSMALSEVCWLRDDPSMELKNFWEGEYPAMRTIKGNLELIKKSGLHAVDHFVLSPEVWWKDFYNPLEVEIKRIRNSDGQTETMKRLLEQTEQEIEMCRRNQGDYGYVFFVVGLG